MRGEIPQHVDVRLTADSQLVCLHDRTLARTAGADEVVSTLTLAELLRYDFGVLKGHPGQHVVRLEDRYGREGTSEP